MLPEGWQKKPLASIATVERGKFSARPRNDPRYYGGNFPFVQTGDVANAGMYLTDFSQTLNSDGLEVSKVFPAGTILMTIAANIGHTAVTVFPVAAPDSVVGISVFPDKADTSWLKYALEAQQTNLDSLAAQNAQKNINLQVLAPLQILVPGLTEQQRIGNLLRTWDRSIEITQRLLLKCSDQRQALTKALLLGTRRLRSCRTTWNYVDFDSVFERVTRKNTTGNCNVLTISGQHGLIGQRDFFNKSIASEDLTGYTLLERGEFAYNKSYSAGYPMGAIKPLHRYDAGVVSSLYICFRLKKDVGADRDFFRHYFQAGLLNEEIAGIAQEGARNHGLLNVGLTDFFKLRLHVPPAEERQRIAEVINIAESEERSIAAQLARLKTEKRALMSQLLTGKRRVCLAEVAVETPA